MEKLYKQLTERMDTLKSLRTYMWEHNIKTTHDIDLAEFRLLRDCKMWLRNYFDIQPLLVCHNIQELIEHDGDRRCNSSPKCYKAVTTTVKNYYFMFPLTESVRRMPSSHSKQERLSNIFEFLRIRDVCNGLQNDAKVIHAARNSQTCVAGALVKRIRDYCMYGVIAPTNRDLRVEMQLYSESILALYHHFAVNALIYVNQSDDGTLYQTLEPTEDSMLCSAIGDIEISTSV